ncbi:MAG: type II toxin-antitoxin system RelE/ParE family toxin [Chitinispirillaceae bacterium]
MIWEYIRQDNPLGANNFIHQLESKIMSLSNNPERHPVIPESEYLQTYRYRHLVYKSYRVVYRIEKLQVFVLRVFHGV